MRSTILYLAVAAYAFSFFPAKAEAPQDSSKSIDTILEQPIKKEDITINNKHYDTIELHREHINDSIVVDYAFLFAYGEEKIQNNLIIFKDMYGDGKLDLMGAWTITSGPENLPSYLAIFNPIWEPNNEDHATYTALTALLDQNKE